MELDRLVEAGMTQGNCVGGSTISDMLGMVRAGPIGGRGNQPYTDRHRPAAPPSQSGYT